MKEKWILFSYSVPAANAKARMRIWRRISATGAVQLKTGLQILPNRDDLLENITWLIEEVNSFGGEALAVRCAQVEGMGDSQIEQLFQVQIGPEFSQIQDEVREITAASLQEQSKDWYKEHVMLLRKLRKRYESLRERDFFPTGAAEKTLVLLDAAGEKLRNPEASSVPLPMFDRTAYQGRTWVTRAQPYVDRLSSFWLVRRFLDPQAAIRFLQPGEVAAKGHVSFDMTGGEFTHQGDLITFEVMVQGFDLLDSPMNRIAELVKCIDVQEGVLPDDAVLLKTLLDGLVALAVDDHQLLEHALVVFDALHAGFSKTVYGEPR